MPVPRYYLYWYKFSSAANMLLPVVPYLPSLYRIKIITTYLDVPRRGYGVPTCTLYSNMMMIRGNTEKYTLLLYFMVYYHVMSGYRRSTPCEM